MKVILVMVSSVNGKITHGEEANIYSWTSDEDKKLFSSLVREHRVIIMGRRTYEAAKDRIRLDPHRLRVVLTANPSRFASENMPGVIEFSDELPRKLLARLERGGYKEALLVGGGDVNALFFRASLVDEMCLTVEPVLFGKGKSLVSQDQFTISLRLTSVEKLNERGTIHLRYLVSR